MNQDILDKLNNLHADYTALQEMQNKLPFKRSRTANHEKTEKEISDAAYQLSRKIQDFKDFCRNHPSYGYDLAKLIGENDEVDSMATGVHTIIFNPYKRF